jgi:hypothetical protein
MSLYSKGLLLIFLRPNFFFEGLGCGMPQPHPSLKKKLLLSPMLNSIKKSAKYKKGRLSKDSLSTALLEK